jgi:hypothetical protein
MQSCNVCNIWEPTINLHHGRLGHTCANANANVYVYARGWKKLFDDVIDRGGPRHAWHVFGKAQGTFCNMPN